MSNTKKTPRPLRLNTVDSDSNHELRLDEGSQGARGLGRYDQLTASDHHGLSLLNQSVEKHHSQHSCNSYAYDHASLETMLKTAVSGLDM